MEAKQSRLFETIITLFFVSHFDYRRRLFKSSLMIISSAHDIIIIIGNISGNWVKIGYLIQMQKQTFRIIFFLMIFIFFFLSNYRILHFKWFMHVGFNVSWENKFKNKINKEKHLSCSASLKEFILCTFFWSTSELIN